MMKDYSLTNLQKTVLFLLSLGIVAFGQPAWNLWLGFFASCAGFALFWRILLAIPSKKSRFYLGFFWFGTIQAVQLSWMVSHPFYYIYAVLLFCSIWLGAQFGLIAIWIQLSLFERLDKIIALAAAWTLLEWSRLFLLSGLSFNPVGLELTYSLYALQFASIGGIYLLSFWVILTNLLGLRAWIYKNSFFKVGSFIFIALVPYLFGWFHLHFHAEKMKQSPTYKVLLVQTATPVEVYGKFKSAEEVREEVLFEWNKILTMLQKYYGKKIDMIVMPEYLVPFGTYYPVYPLKEVYPLFKTLFSLNQLQALPILDHPFADFLETAQGPQWLISNAFFAQSIANLFQANVVVGLADTVYTDEEKKESYSAAFHFSPDHQTPQRYEKRVLVPMGEYIPFSFCREIASRYGIAGSFTCGESAKVFGDKISFSPSICYEETYGHLMREGCTQGARLLVNLTNDGWFPHSRLPKQHFDHARLRTVENGVPLIRACNTGITGAVDSVGREVKILKNESQDLQDIQDALYVEVPSYHYSTLYSRWGDYFIVISSLFFLFLPFFLLKILRVN